MTTNEGLIFSSPLHEFSIPWILIRSIKIVSIFVNRKPQSALCVEQLEKRGNFFFHDFRDLNFVENVVHSLWQSHVPAPLPPNANVAKDDRVATRGSGVTPQQAKEQENNNSSVNSHSKLDGSFLISKKNRHFSFSTQSTNHAVSWFHIIMIMLIVILFFLGLISFFYSNGIQCHKRSSVIIPPKRFTNRMCSFKLFCFLSERVREKLRAAAKYYRRFPSNPGDDPYVALSDVDLLVLLPEIPKLLEPFFAAKNFSSQTLQYSLLDFLSLAGPLQYRVMETVLDYLQKENVVSTLQVLVGAIQRHQCLRRVNDFFGRTVSPPCNWTSSKCRKKERQKIFHVSNEFLFSYLERNILLEEMESLSPIYARDPSRESLHNALTSNEAYRYHFFLRGGALFTEIFGFGTFFSSWATIYLNL